IAPPATRAHWPQTVSILIGAGHGASSLQRSDESRHCMRPAVVTTHSPTSNASCFAAGSFVRTANFTAGFGGGAGGGLGWPRPRPRAGRRGGAWRGGGGGHGALGPKQLVEPSSNRPQTTPSRLAISTTPSIPPRTGTPSSPQ